MNRKELPQCDEIASVCNILMLMIRFLYDAVTITFCDIKGLLMLVFELVKLGFEVKYVDSEGDIVDGKV
jgi:hypothetical protein